MKDLSDKMGAIQQQCVSLANIFDCY